MVVQEEQEHAIDQQLKEALRQYFDLDEIKDLCDDLGIHHENLRAGTKNELARELVRYCRHRQRTGDLITEIEQRRSFISIVPPPPLLSRPLPYRRGLAPIVLIGLLLLLSAAAIGIASKSIVERGIGPQPTEVSQPIPTAMLSAIPSPTSAPSNTPIPTSLPIPAPTPGLIAVRSFKVRLDNREILIDPGETIEVRKGDALTLEVVFDNAPDGLILTYDWTSEKKFIPRTTTFTSSTIYNVPTESGADPIFDTVTVEIRSGNRTLIKSHIFVKVKQD